MRKVYKGMPFHHRGMNADVYPWMHETHTFVGFAVVYTDPEQQDELYYFVPSEEGTDFSCRVHHTTISVSRDRGVRLGSDVDPDTDPCVTDVELK